MNKPLLPAVVKCEYCGSFYHFESVFKSIIKCPGCGASYKEIVRNRITKNTKYKKNVRSNKKSVIDTRGVKILPPLSPEKYERNLGIAFVVASFVLLGWSVLYMF